MVPQSCYRHHGQRRVWDAGLPPRHAVACGLSPPMVPSPPVLNSQGMAVSALRSGPWASVAPCSQAGRPCASAPPPPARGASRSVPLDHHPIRKGGVLDDDHNAIADDKAQVFLVGLLHVVLVYNPDLAPDAS